MPVFLLERWVGRLWHRLQKVLAGETPRGESRSIRRAVPPAAADLVERLQTVVRLRLM